MAPRAGRAAMRPLLRWAALVLLALFLLQLFFVGRIAAMALWFRNFSTWDGVAGIHLEDLFVVTTCPDGPSWVMVIVPT